jgi:hypothetical protein
MRGKNREMDANGKIVQHGKADQPKKSGLDLRD